MPTGQVVEQIEEVGIDHDVVAEGFLEGSARHANKGLGMREIEEVAHPDNALAFGLGHRLVLVGEAAARLGEQLTIS